MKSTQWPKVFPKLTSEQKRISDDFMEFWHHKLASNKRYGLIEQFNHGYAIKHGPKNFLSTLEIGAGIGEHLSYEQLSKEQKQHYVALEMRENMAQRIQEKYPDIQVCVGDCQKPLALEANRFDRILAIHVLEHLPNLPAAIEEMYRLCNKEQGIFSVVIPCEGGMMYSFARKVSAQRLFEKRYRQPYQWFIEREHVNKPQEIIQELEKYFTISQRSYFPFKIPCTQLNLCIGLTLHPKRKP